MRRGATKRNGQRGGALTSVSVFETQAELATGDRLVARWLADHLGTALPDPPRITSGEVIVQRGL